MSGTVAHKTALKHELVARAMAARRQMVTNPETKTPKLNQVSACTAASL